jgi:hypothetical protein
VDSVETGRMPDDGQEWRVDAWARIQKPDFVRPEYPNQGTSMMEFPKWSNGLSKDEVAFYKRPLTPCEISWFYTHGHLDTANMYASQGGPCPDPVSTVAFHDQAPVTGNAMSLMCMPNPFSTGVTISVRGPSHVARHEVRLEVFNIAGKMVANIKPRATSDERRATNYTWHAKDQSSGIYLVKVKLGDKVLMRKVTLLK